ncbi:pilus assembly PilX family protein [Sedimenticola sp.]|uniref:pilus assembly PilX family protein n=1 Tax=Sedimenticola sp. TaxID=1940285 RepID=UPI003D0D5D93
MNRYSITNGRKQQGAVLVVSLLILLIMSLIGISSMQNTVLEERMAGNLKDQNMALEAAEAALRDGEAYIETIVTTGGFNGTNGLYGLTDDEDATTWGASDSKAYPQTYTTAGNLGYVDSQPRFIIKLAGTIAGAQGAKNIGGYGKGLSAKDTTAFEVTARGVGKSPNSEVRLRTVYGRKM